MKAAKPAPLPAPTPMPDDTLLNQNKKKVAAQQAQRSGRASTILSQGNQDGGGKLGN